MNSKTINMNFDKMGKNELRAACKAAGLSYAKLNNDGMRAALKGAYVEPEAAPTTAVEGAPASLVLTAVTKAAREERNGVKRPREGGLCAQVWAALDQMRAAGIEPSTKDIRGWSIEKGFNVNNSTAELSAWRKFNGISRSVLKVPAKRKPAAKAAQPARRIDGEVDQYVA
jgi:hypothetical protein|nr:hypothetical protein [uncultured Steroidobacter sp.]